jgi:hypothetical protein
VTGALRLAGVALSPAVALGLRLAAAGATLALWLRAAGRTREPWRGLTLVLLSTSYLVLFNPMTEKNTYAIAAPAFAAAAAALLGSPAHRLEGWLLATALLSIGLLPQAMWPVSRDFGLWWNPAVFLAVSAFLAWRILRDGAIFDARQAPGVSGAGAEGRG